MPESWSESVFVPAEKEVQSHAQVRFFEETYLKGGQSDVQF